MSISPEYYALAYGLFLSPLNLQSLGNITWWSLSASRKLFGQETCASSMMRS